MALTILPINVGLIALTATLVALAILPTLRRGFLCGQSPVWESVSAVQQQEEAVSIDCSVQVFLDPPEKSVTDMLTMQRTRGH